MKSEKDNSHLKRTLEFIVTGATIAGLFGCTPTPTTPGSNSNGSGNNEDVSKKPPIIRNVKIDYDNNRIFNRVVSFTVDTYDSNTVYVSLRTNGSKKKWLFFDEKDGTPNDLGGITVSSTEIISDSVLYGNMRAYEVEIEAATSGSLSNSTLYSTNVTTPLPIFGRKAPTEVSKLEDILSTLISEDKQEDMYDAMYYTPLGVKNIRVHLNELETARRMFVIADNGDGTGFFMDAYFLEPLDRDATLIEYTVDRYQSPVGENLSLEEYLKYIIGVEVKKIWYDPDRESTEVIAPRPKEIFKHSTSEEEELLYPMHETKAFMLDDTKFIAKTDRYYTGITPTTSKTPLYRLKYFFNEDDLFGFNQETGNLLALFIHSERLLETGEASVILFSPLYFTGPTPGDDFYRQQDAVILDNNWDRPIYRYSDIPNDYKNLVTEALDDAIEAIDNIVGY